MKLKYLGQIFLPQTDFSLAYKSFGGGRRSINEFVSLLFYLFWISLLSVIEHRAYWRHKIWPVSRRRTLERSITDGTSQDRFNHIYGEFTVGSSCPLAVYLVFLANHLFSFGPVVTNSSVETQDGSVNRTGDILYKVIASSYNTHSKVKYISLSLSSDKFCLNLRNLLCPIICAQVYHSLCEVTWFHTLIKFHINQRKPLVSYFLILLAPTFMEH